MFAQRLKGLRKQAGYTQTDLGERIGVAKSTIAGYEKGFRKPKMEILNQLAEIFHTSADFILGLTNDRTPKEPSKDIEQILKEPDYHYRGKKLTNEELDLLLKYLDIIYKAEHRNDNIEINNESSNNNSEIIKH